MYDDPAVSNMEIVMKYRYLVLIPIILLLSVSCKEIFLEERDRGNISIDFETGGDNTFGGSKATLSFRHQGSGYEFNKEMTISDSEGFGHLFIPRVKSGEWEIGIEVLNNINEKIPGEGNTGVEVIADRTSILDITVAPVDGSLEYLFAQDVLGILESPVKISFFDNIFFFSREGGASSSVFDGCQWTFAAGSFDFLSECGVTYPDEMTFSFNTRAPGLNCTVVYTPSGFHVKRSDSGTAPEKQGETSLTLKDMNGALLKRSDDLRHDLSDIGQRVPYIAGGQFPVHGGLNVDSGAAVNLEWTVDSVSGAGSIWTFVSSAYNPDNMVFSKKEILASGTGITVIPFNAGDPLLAPDSWYSALTMTFDSDVSQQDVDRIEQYSYEGILMGIMAERNLLCVTAMERLFKTMP